MQIKTITCHEVYNHGASLQVYALLRVANDAIPYKPDGISRHFELWGMKNLYRFLKECDLYVQSSLHEGFGITVVEAKVFSKPIVLTDFASAKDLITNKVTGMIADNSAESLYFCIKKLLEDPGLQQKFIKNLKIEPRNSSDIAKLTYTI